MIKILLQIALGAAALAGAVYFLARTFSWEDASAAVSALSWQFVVTAAVLSLTMTFLKATRFYILLHWSGIEASWPKTILTFKASEAFTPLPIGELGRAIIFGKRLKMGMARVAVPVFIQGLLELWSAAFLAALGAATFQGISAAWIIAPIAILAVLTVPFAFPDAVPRLLGRIRNGRPWVMRMHETAEESSRFVKKIRTPARRRFIAITIALGLAVHGVAGVLLWHVAVSLGADISIPQAAFSAASASLIQGILWMIPGGLGVTEGGLAAILNSFSMPWGKAIAVTLLYRIVMLPFSFLIALIALAAIYLPKAAGLRGRA